MENMTLFKTIAADVARAFSCRRLFPAGTGEEKGMVWTSPCKMKITNVAQFLNQKAAMVKGREDGYQYKVVSPAIKPVNALAQDWLGSMVTMQCTVNGAVYDVLVSIVTCVADQRSVDISPVTIYIVKSDKQPDEQSQGE